MWGCTVSLIHYCLRPPSYLIHSFGPPENADLFNFTGSRLWAKNLVSRVFRIHPCVKIEMKWRDFWFIYPAFHHYTPDINLHSNSVTLLFNSQFFSCVDWVMLSIESADCSYETLLDSTIRNPWRKHVSSYLITLRVKEM